MKKLFLKKEIPTVPLEGRIKFFCKVSMKWEKKIIVQEEIKMLKKKAIAPVQNKLEPKLLCQVQRRIQGLIFGGAQNRT